MSLLKKLKECAAVGLLLAGSTIYVDGLAESMMSNKKPKESDVAYKLFLGGVAMYAGTMLKSPKNYWSENE